MNCRELLMRRVSFLFLLCASLFAACLPIPHHQRRAPAIQGVLRQAGAPLVGARVWMQVNPRRRAQDDANGACRGRQTVTREDGAFFFEETTEFVYLFWMGDRRDVWTLCFELPDGRRVTWQDSGYWGGPKRMDLRCGTEPSEARIVGASGFRCHKSRSSR
jgi:hypothetical protein